MRPIKLIMQAFGAYPQKVEIPFEKLGANNIYLIYGATGSGKTTIFDAISYALFSVPSGQYRKNLNLRSHYVSDEVETYVQLEFLHKGEKYLVFRSMKMNKGKIKTSSLLVLPDKNTIIGNKEVDNYIVELLNINASQFSQIALLAQGEFLKLLNPDTKSRSEIFRNLFKTNDFKIFQERLKALSIAYRKSFDEIKKSVIQYCCDIESNSDVLNKFIENYSNNSCIVDFDEFLKLIENQNDLDENELESFKNLLDEVDKEIIENEKKLQLILNKQKLISEKDDLLIKLKTQEEIFKKIKDEFSKIAKKENKEKELILEIEKSKKDYESSILIKNLEEKNKILIKSLEENQKKLKENFDKIENLKNNYLKFLSNQYLNLEENLEKSQQDFINFKKDYDELSRLYDIQYDKYLSSQAGILAKMLKKNAPCPVCGSTNHPVVAKLADEVISKDELDKIKISLEKKSKLLNEKSQNCLILNEKKQQKFLEYEKESKRFKIDIEIKNYDVDDFNYLLKIDELENLNEQIIEKNQLLNLDIEKNSTQIAVLNKDLTNFDINKNLEIFENLKIQKDELSAEIKSIKTNYEKESMLYNELKTRIDVISKQIDDFSKIKISTHDEISKIIADCNLKKADLNNKFNIINARFLNNKKLLPKLNEGYKKYLEIEKIYTQYDILSRCANGDMVGKPKIEFEQYIQGYYLDMVLHEANKRFQVMTKNQYRLLRKKDFTSIQSKESLELEVMDFHTFQKRTTKSLSGGESFMAALSLALGLSDCISAYSNVSIDALFIDEGFGSLDYNTLQCAMDVIGDLSSSNKLVGIISHVEDIKSRIQNQILTTKTDLGSSIEISF